MTKRFPRKQLRGIQIVTVDKQLDRTVGLELSGEVWDELVPPPLPIWTWRDERTGVWHPLLRALRRELV